MPKAYVIARANVTNANVWAEYAAKAVIYAFLTVTAGLLLQRPLPALPFIAIAFVIVNADLIVSSVAKRR